MGRAGLILRDDESAPSGANLSSRIRSEAGRSVECDDTVCPCFDFGEDGVAFVGVDFEAFSGEAEEVGFAGRIANAVTDVEFHVPPCGVVCQRGTGIHIADESPDVDSAAAACIHPLIQCGGVRAAAAVYGGPYQTAGI